MNSSCVFIIDAELHPGLAADTAAALALSLGSSHREFVGRDLHAQDGRIHPGITVAPLPVLRGTPEQIAAIIAGARGESDDAMRAIGFTNQAQACRSDDAYAERLSATSPGVQRCLGACLYGDRRRINSLTGSLPLLR